MNNEQFTGHSLVHNGEKGGQHLCNPRCKLAGCPFVTHGDMSTIVIFGGIQSCGAHALTRDCVN